MKVLRFLGGGDRLARLHGGQEDEGSNPFAPTTDKVSEVSIDTFRETISLDKALAIYSSESSGASSDC